MLKVSEKDYRKVIFETENPFVSIKFGRFVGENNFPCRCVKQGKGYEYTLYLTDDQINNTEKAIHGMLEYCKRKLQSLNEKKSFLSEYFDSVYVFDAISVGLELRMKAWESEPVHFPVYCDKNDELTWKHLLLAVKPWMTSTQSWFFHLRDRYLMEEPEKTTEELMEMAEKIQKRLEDCAAAIEKKIKEEKV